MGVSELAQNDALRSLNSMMHNNLFPRMNVPRGSDDVMSGIANGYNMMGTIMEGIRARNDRNRLQELLKQQFGNGENKQPTQNENGYSLSLGDTEKLNSFQNSLVNNLTQEQKPDYSFSLGETDKVNSLRGILGDNNAMPVSNQASQQDYSMQTFMRNAINKGMLPSNAMQAYSAYFAPIEQDIRERNVRDAMRTLAFRNHGLSKEDEINALATINYNMGKNYAWEDESNRFDRDLKYDKNVLQPNGLWNPEMYNEYSDKYRIADDAYAGLNSLGVGSYGNTNISAGSNAGFSQTDGNWSDTPYAGGTIGTSGCAPTTMANFLQRFGVNVTPADVAKYSSDHGFAQGQGGTSWGMFSAVGDKVGVPVQQTGSWADVMNALKAGQPVMAGHDPGKFTQNAYGGSGHWLMYNGITPDGKIIVVDPNNGKKSGAYTAEEVRGDWERNNPVAFVAKDNKALPMQQQERQSFGNYLAQPVNRGGGARMSPMAMRKLATEEAERQRLQSNADRQYMLGLERLKQQRELAEQRIATRNGNGTGNGSGKGKNMSTQEYVKTIMEYSDTPETDENGKSAISRELIDKVGQAWSGELNKIIQDKNGNIEDAVKQMYYNKHKDKDKGYTLSHKKLVAGINSALASLSDSSNNENILKQQNAISHILDEYAKELGTTTEENNGYFPKKITYWDDMFKEDENGNVMKDSNGNPILIEPLGSRNDFNTERDIEVGIIEDKIKKRDQYIREHGGYVSVPTHLGNKTENENAITHNEQLRKEANAYAGLTEEQEKFYYNNRASTNQRQNEEVNYYENKKKENQID